MARLLQLGIQALWLSFICNLGVSSASTPFESVSREATLSTHVLPSTRSIVAVTSRALAVGDFEPVNEILREATLQLGDLELAFVFQGIPLTFALKNLTCFNIEIGDLQVASTQPSAQQLKALLELLDLQLQCEGDFRFSAPFGIGGGGVLSFDIIDTEVDVGILLTSDDFAKEPPKFLNITDCSSVVNLGDVVFDIEGIQSNIVESAIGDIGDELIAGEVRNIICSLVNNIEDLVAPYVTSIYDLLIPYVDGTTESSSLTSDPLATEQALTIPSDWTPADVFGTGEGNEPHFIWTLIQDVTRGFSDIDPETGELGINKIVRDSLLGGKSSLTLPGSLLSIILGTDSFAIQTDFISFALTVKEFQIRNLDSFSRFDPITAVGDYTVTAGLALPNVDIGIAAEIYVESGNGEKSLIENVVLDIPVGDIDVSLAFLIILSQESLGSLPLGAILRDDMFECLSSLFYALKLVFFQMDPIEFQQPSITGFQVVGLERVVTDAVDIIYSAYESSLSPFVTNFLRTTVVDKINDFLAEIVKGGDCSDLQLLASPGARDPTVDLRDLLLPGDIALDYGGSGTEPYGSLVPAVVGFLNNGFLTSESIPELINLIAGFLGGNLTDGSGSIMLKETIIEYDDEVDALGFAGRIAFRLGGIRIENIDSIGEPIQLLQPIPNQPYVVNNTAMLGVLPRSLRVRGSFLIQIESGDVRMHNEVDFGLDIGSTQLVAELLGRLNQRRFLGMPIASVTDLHCWLAAFHTPQLDKYGIRIAGNRASLSVLDLALVLGDFQLMFDCISCTTEQFAEVSDLLELPEGKEDAKRLGQRLVDILTELASGESSIVQTVIDRWLVDAPANCPYRPEYNASAVPTVYEEYERVDGNPDAIEFLLAVLLLVAFLCVITVGTVLLVRRFVRRRHIEWLEMLPDEQLLVIFRMQEKKEKYESEVNDLALSLFQSPDIPIFVRWFFPFVVLGNIALFASGHFSTGGAVRLYIQIGDDQLVIDEIYSFSIIQIIRDLWNGGSRFAPMIVLILSFLWPYLKQFISLAAWMLPTNRLPLQRRGRILQWLDMLAKWSMLDVFIMILALVAFNVQFRLPSGVSFLPNDLVSADLVLVPVWGLYANFMAQLVSQISSHFVLHYQRRTEATARREHQRLNGPLDKSKTADPNEFDSPPSDSFAVVGVPQEDAGFELSTVEPYEALCRHAFIRPHRGEAEPLVIRPGVNVAVVLTAAVVCIMVIIGCSIASYSVELQGLAELIVRKGKDFYSVFDSATVIMDESRFLDTAKDKLGLFSVACVLVITTLVVPIFLAIALVLQWLYPLSPKLRDRLEVVIEILEAWQYVEVYLLAAVIGSWQVGEVSVWIVSEICEPLEGIFASLVVNGILDPIQSQCFRVQSKLEAGSYVLLFASVLLSLLNAFVSKAVRQVQYQRMQRLWMEQVVNSDMTRADGEISSDDDIGIEQGRHQASDGPVKVKVEDIHPMPVLFTDQFRWALSTYSSTPTSSS